MAWASVSWAYKDLISSAKLAQMIENLRVHDHVSTDQGNPLFPAWTVFAPTWAQGVAVGFSQNGSRWVQLNKLVIAHYDLIANSAGTAGSAWALSLPIAARAISDLQGAFFGAYGGVTMYKLVTLPASTATLNFQDTGAGAMGSAPAVTIASGDKLRGTIVYEAP